MCMYSSLSLDKFEYTHIEPFCAHHLEMDYYVNFLGHLALGSKGFQVI